MAVLKMMHIFEVYYIMTGFHNQIHHHAKPLDIRQESYSLVGLGTAFS
jgi:hypothetical protein